MEYTPPAPLSRTEIDKGWALEIVYVIRSNIGEITVLHEYETNRITVSLPAVVIKPGNMPLYIQACVLAYGEASRLAA